MTKYLISFQLLEEHVSEYKNLQVMIYTTQRQSGTSYISGVAVSLSGTTIIISDIVMVNQYYVTLPFINIDVSVTQITNLFININVHGLRIGFGDGRVYLIAQNVYLEKVRFCYSQSQLITKVSHKGTSKRNFRFRELKKKKDKTTRLPKNCVILVFVMKKDETWLLYLCFHPGL